MKAYKIEILVIDFDELGEAAIKEELERVSFPNDCITTELCATSAK